ncbi:MAG: isocitrate/isopropylmalate dehydrogenase family protein [Anaerolineales bacterium]
MHTICLIPGDGIGQEVVPAAAEVLLGMGLDLAFVEAEAGFGCFERHGSALPEATLALVRKSDAVLFGATSSPSSIVSGYRSPILALRREFTLFANLRPVFSLPGIYSRPGIDLLIVRENTEGLYSGREHREGDTAIAERVITRTGSERIVRVACEQAMQRAGRRGKPPVLTVVHKANVLKLTDGLFRECALKVAAEFPAISLNELLVDSAAMKLVKSPQSFDVLVTTNLFGDILSDEASALVGGLGVAPSANIGRGTPVFEPVHGSAPDIAGQGIANPVGALLSSALMLEGLGEPEAAGRLRQAVLDTLASGLCTADLGGSATTMQFTRAVCAHL